MAQFVAVTAATGKLEAFINLDQVRMVDEIGPGHCRATFSPEHVVQINGPGAAEFLAIVTKHLSGDGRLDPPERPEVGVKIVMPETTAVRSDASVVTLDTPGRP
jgi:hypothetical protein